MPPKKGRDSGKRRLRVVDSADPGPPYVVRWHPGAEAEREASWPAGEKVAIQHAIEKLRQIGPRLTFPHSSAVQGVVGKGFRELRPKSG